ASPSSAARRCPARPPTSPSCSRTKPRSGRKWSSCRARRRTENASPLALFLLLRTDRFPVRPRGLLRKLPRPFEKQRRRRVIVRDKREFLDHCPLVRWTLASMQWLVARAQTVQLCIRSRQLAAQRHVLCLHLR